LRVQAALPAFQPQTRGNSTTNEDSDVLQARIPFGNRRGILQG